MGKVFHNTRETVSNRISHSQGHKVAGQSLCLVMESPEHVYLLFFLFFGY